MSRFFSGAVPAGLLWNRENQTRDPRLCVALSITERRRVAEYPAHPPRDPGWQVVGNNPAIGRPPRERNPRLIAAAAARYRDTSLPCIRETRRRWRRGRRRRSKLDVSCTHRHIIEMKRRKLATLGLCISIQRERIRLESSSERYYFKIYVYTIF